tara:strand:- start:167 stop:1252 length:1086 start_codon:yes stop_codon:yes gene_type:complete
MDSFVTIKKQKKKCEISLRDKEINLVKQYLDENKNVFICGSSGYGKTFILNQIFDETNSIELWEETLRKKDVFLDTVRHSNKHVYIEDYESDTHVYKNIIESVSEGKKITKKQLIVTSKNVYFMDNFVTIILNKLEPDSIIKLKPTHPNAILSSKMCKGNIHNFYYYLDFPYEKDIFESPKEIVKNILCKGDDIDISNSLHEHGHIWAVVQENFPDVIEDNFDKVARSLTDADLFDEEIYKGEWDIMPYFTLHAVKIPRMYFTKSINTETIRPGKFWTKFGNQKMRHQKIHSIQSRSKTHMNHQTFMVLREYAKKGDVSKFKEYNLTPQDFDVMNHLGIQNKLKQREVTKIKKLIKEEITV